MADITKMSKEEVLAYLDELDTQRIKIREQARVAQAHLQQILKDEQHSHWGLTEEQYNAAKVAAADAKEPLHIHLNKARSAILKQVHKAQTAKAAPVQVGVAVKK